MLSLNAMQWQWTVTPHKSVMRVNKDTTVCCVAIDFRYCIFMILQPIISLQCISMYPSSSILKTFAT